MSNDNIKDPNLEARRKRAQAKSSEDEKFPSKDEGVPTLPPSVKGAAKGTSKPMNSQATIISFKDYLER